jgi:5-methylcytosine-specific restriction endonuclease McrA
VSPELEKWILKYLLSRLTQMWGWHVERRAVLDAARVGFDKWRCAECGKVCGRTEREVDHVIARGPRPKTLKEFEPYVRATLCSRENLRVLCKPCHKVKTAADGKKRRASKREK